ncbi:MAG: hypothetical protein KGS72_26215 [Cyanobacteria bacterium REEB67]|nr:hypothetical protein [Cyanobacteria bacterium REEB67]
MLTQENFVFVLVRPNFLGNIGSTARVMKNFGFTQLRMVSPPKNYLDSEARRMAVDAFDILKKARVFDSVSAALEDINIAVGSSSGQYRTHISQNLAPLAESLFQELSDGNKIAMVFGDERNGMTNEELDRCHKLMRIESNPLFPSLNLAQALGVVAYQLSLQIKTHDNEASSDTSQYARPEGLPEGLRMTGALEDQLMERIVTLMDDVEFSRSFNRTKVTGELRNTLQKFNLTQREGLLWQGLLSKVLARLARQSD